MCNVQEDKKLELEMLQKLDDIIHQHAEDDGALIPILQKAQDLYGYLPEKVIKRIAFQLQKPYSEVAGVVGFYSYFSTVPKGQFEVRVCLGTACYVRGANDVLQAIKDDLNIGVGETTNDRVFSLSAGRCFGACGLAPVIMVNDEVYQRVKPSKVGEILNGYRKAIKLQENEH
jgi:NADH:ubiquinone oxidoreductase subunit E